MSNRSSNKRLRLALVAHDAKKDLMVEWARANGDTLKHAHIFATGTTGGRISAALPNLEVTALKSGPLGGDQQIGAIECGC